MKKLNLVPEQIKHLTNLAELMKTARMFHKCSGEVFTYIYENEEEFYHTDQITSENTFCQNVLDDIKQYALYYYNDDCFDGRTFRDCSFNYERIFNIIDNNN